MKNCSNRFFNTILLLVVLLATLTMGGCLKVADADLGNNIMPEGQVMVMRHLKYQGNTKIYYNADSDRNETQQVDNLIETRLYRTDSLLASNVGSGYLGVRRSNVFGERKASFASTLLFMNAIDTEVGFGYKPIFDTMKLVLSVSDYGGDTLIPIRYKVYELLKPLKKSVFEYDDKRKDSVAYINCDLSSVYDESKPIFEFTFPNSELKEGPSTLMIPMETTDYSWDFVRRLMLIPENYADANSNWDGYGRSGIEMYSDDTKWIKHFHGLYIVPDLEATAALGDIKEGAMYALDLTASGIMLQGRSRNPKDPTMIKDTVGMYYYFRDESSTINNSVNKIERDYTNASLKEEDMSSLNNERPTVSTCYVEGTGGPSTEIYFTDAFLDELFSLDESMEIEYSKMGINQCLMTVYVNGASYKWEDNQTPSIDAWTSMYDVAFTRLGAYVNYNRFAPIADYDYLMEDTYGNSAVYDGYLDRSRGCYTLNITAYIQQLYNYAKRVRQQEEDGSYSYLFQETDNDYVSRRIYLGVEATKPYSFAESTIQGMTKDENGNESSAPIQFDLTYTLIK